MSATSVRPAASAGNETTPAARGIYVWELPVRLAHWLIVGSIIVLSITGIYIHTPFIAPPVGDESARLMGQVRFIHELTALIFTAAVAWRVVWSFVGNQYAQWRAIVPHTRAQWRGIGQMLAYYTFRRDEPPPAVGHNSLAGLAYLVVYAGFVGQILTGFLLFGWLLGTGPFAFFFGWSSLVPGGIQTVRLLHFLLTFAFLAFAVHHVYSSVLIDLEERTGILSSIVTGFKHRSTPRSEAELEAARKEGADA
jgi:Ni/Fe-hydrogenase 1 B-type cytochrome subunit